MSGFRPRPIVLVLALIGAALLVAALSLWAVSRLQLHSAGLTPMNAALFTVPEVVGVVAGVSAVILLVLPYGHRPAVSRAAADPRSGSPVGAGGHDLQESAESTAQ